MMLRPLMTFLLIYVVGAECDPVSVRTNYRHETVDLYRTQRLGRRCAAVATNLPRADQRTCRSAAVLSSADQQLHDQHYSLCKRSRPGGSVRDPPSPQRFDRWYLYYSGWVNTTLSYEELRQRSLIKEAAQAANGAPDFSPGIRASLPTISP
jgi:hypothetical protein